MVPDWLHYLSIAYLAFGWLCVGIVVADLLRHPQHMWIMNVVWPITALFGTTWILWQYFSYERLARYDKSHAAIGRNGEPSTEQRALLPIIVANGALHCGSECALGDLCAEWLAFGLPTVAMTLGWQRLFPDKIFAAWILDYVLAYAFGVVFKYFTIRPMRGLSFSAGDLPLDFRSVD